MKRVVSSAEMREIDRQTTGRFGIESLVLMENAANGVARAIMQSLSGGVARKRILVLCGKGNNGGDGAAAARLLAIACAHVDVVLFGKLADTKGDARTNFERLQSLKDEPAFQDATSTGSINLFECDSAKAWSQLQDNVLSTPFAVIVDALFGTGLTRPAEGIYAEAIEYLRKQKSDDERALIVSVDIPSGLNSDSHEVDGAAVSADVTVTMTAPKTANVLPPAGDYNGKVIVADIGSPVELVDESSSQLFLVEESDARDWLIQTRYTRDSYKNTHGHALIVAGSRGFTGAAALCGNATMSAGAGLVTVATPASVQPLVATQVMPEVMTTELAETDRGVISDDAIAYFSKFSERADVIAIGPGISSEDERTRKFVHSVVASRPAPVVIDADGLNCLSPWPAELKGSTEHPIVLTPHPGEMLRLMGARDKSALSDRVAAARQFAKQHQVFLLLKGTRSLIAAPDGRVFVNPTGNAGLGTAGAGDTLTGVITGFLAQARGLRSSGKQIGVLETVIAALYVSGLAGDFAARELGMRCMVASDIREYLSAAICALDPHGEMP